MYKGSGIYGGKGIYNASGGTAQTNVEALYPRQDVEPLLEIEVECSGINVE